MFIAHVDGERSLAPEERNVLLARPNISLLWSFKILGDPGSINISPSGTEDWATKNQTDSVDARTLETPHQLVKLIRRAIASPFSFSPQSV